MKTQVNRQPRGAESDRGAQARAAASFVNNHAYKKLNSAIVAATPKPEAKKAKPAAPAKPVSSNRFAALDE